ncbi:hypothetical protein EDC96DRAFT_491438 [Choanephora cucurbitarum]|nr:hypothetical protein EDC96DRAFT_491438 [Choanephora cucurbitarum]
MKNLSAELIELIANCCDSPKDKASLCQVNRYCYLSAIHVLYRNITIASPRQYEIVRNSLKRPTKLSCYVHRLDFSCYTVRGSRWSEDKAKAAIIPEELGNLIGCCDFLKELLIGEEMMHVLVSPAVIQAIFNSQKLRLHTIDFTGLCSPKLSTLFTEPIIEPKENENYSNNEHQQEAIVPPSKLNQTWSIPGQLCNLSFFMCSAFSQDQFFIPFFNSLSMNGNRLKKLDLAYTQANNELFSHLIIHKQYETLTHLSLQGCRSVRCCSSLITFIEHCDHLEELNLNTGLSGVRGSGFCHECIFRILKAASRSNIQLLDMGGHINLDNFILSRLMAEQIKLARIKSLSLVYCQSVTLKKLEEFLLYNDRSQHLFYLNLSNTPMMNDSNGELICTLSQIKSRLPQIKAVEINAMTSKRYSLQSNDYWKLITHGKRAYYSQKNFDPRFVYSKKMIMSQPCEQSSLSPMVKYWCYFS